jgi:Zn-finger nucleic acid-binding protein
MKCPVCSCDLTETESHGLLLDICREGCGGVWFDAKELDKADENQEPVRHEVLRPVRNQNIVIDRNKQRLCPRCDGVGMKKELYDSQFEIEIDSCPSCGGIWLDLGELEALRAHNSGHQQRQALINTYEELSASADGSVRERLKAVCRLVF